jgi:hypothetical protein
MIANPAELAVTLPELLTVATLGLLDDHVTFLFVALSGFTVAVSVLESSTFRFSETGDTDTSVTATGGVGASVTVTVQESDLVGSACDLAVIDTVPAPIAVTTHSFPPDSDIFTIPDVAVDHVTLLLEA